MPGAARRMYPARISQRWLGTSASAGSSRSVRTNSSDIRVITSGAFRAVEATRRASGCRRSPYPGPTQGHDRKSAHGPEVVVVQGDGAGVPVHGDPLAVADALRANPGPQHRRDAVLAGDDGAVAERAADVG